MNCAKKLLGLFVVKLFIFLMDRVERKEERGEKKRQGF